MQTANLAMTGSASPARNCFDSAMQYFSQQFNTPFFLYDLELLEPVITSTPCQPAPGRLRWLADLSDEMRGNARVVVRHIADELHALVIPLKERRQVEAVAIALFLAAPLTPQERLPLTEWLGDDYPIQAIPFCQPELLARLGEAVLLGYETRRQLHTRESEVKQMASQLSRNYEEITLLHQLTRASRVSHGLRELRELTLSLVSDMLPVRQLAYVDARKEEFLSTGERCAGADLCREIVRVLASQSTDSVVVDNHLRARAVPDRIADIERIVLVPVIEGKELLGWILALGTTDGSELGSVEASLMTAVAAILATHHTNVKLFGNIKDLFLGVVRAMTSAIDAKDPSTCGHSERVAHIARRLAQQLGVPEDEQNRIYLSGLLHDVGKIGIRDSILLKPSRLEPDELAHIKEHPRIGFDILCGVRQLKAVLAGVRSHHENYDGTGYPDSLKGDDIPLMARIVAVADSYDAMVTDRPYRKGMDSVQVERIFREGSGRQWDGRVIDAFLTLHPSLETEREQLQSRTSNSDGRHARLDPVNHPVDLGQISTIISLSVT